MPSVNLGIKLKSRGSPLKAGVEIVVGRGFGVHLEPALGM